MSWLAYAILAPSLWACCNIMDQYMARHVGHESMAGLVILQYCCLPFVILGLFLYVFFSTGAPPALHPSSLMWLGPGAVVCILALIPYLHALKRDEAYNAVPFYQFIPVMVAFLAWLLFGDRLAGLQLLGAALVIAGGFLFAWDFRRGHIRPRTLLLMLASSVCYAIYQTALRYASHRDAVWDITFYAACGFFLCAAAIFALAPGPRGLFLRSIRDSRGKILAVAGAQSLTDAAAFTCLTFAFAKAPGAGQVAALSGVQPIAALAAGALCGIFLPGRYAPVKWNREMAIKCVLLLVIAAGIALLKPQ